MSDKGNDLVMEDIEIYEKQIEEQTGKDEPIERKDVIENERRLNTVLKNFNNTFSMGAAHGKDNRKRIWDNGYCVGESAALINITTKTHKKMPDTGIPKSRAVTDAGECSTSQLGNSLAMLIEACMKSQEWDGECLSTQHQLALFREVNEGMAPYVRKEWSGQEEDVVSGGAGLFSGDVEALYPSLEKETCARAAGRTVARNWGKVKGVNICHALVGLASANTKEIKDHMKERGITNVMPVRKSSKGKRPGEFTEELTKLAECRKAGEVQDLGESWTLPTASKWRLIQDTYTREQEEAIIEVYVAHVAKTIMSCHMYNIGGVVKLQRTGGPAGLRVTGTLARNLMGEWRR